MTIDNIEIVIYTFQFIIPGYIIGEIISAIMPQKTYGEGEKLLRYIGYSVVNIALWYWVFVLISQYCKLGTFIYWMCNVFGVLITGCVTGLIIGIIRAKNIVRKLFQKIGLNLIHPVPTAWDYKFSDKEECWVEVTVSDNKVIRGLYSNSSLASSDSDFRDIFLQELYVKQDAEWIKVERTSGVWLSPNEIRYIKFYKMEE